LNCRSFQKTFTNKDKTTSTNGYANDGFASDEADNEVKREVPKRKLTPEQKLQKLLLKAPLEKSMSMPDMETRMKNRHKMMA
jgi:hypothetical protein